MAKVRRHVLVCSNLDCLSWPLPRAVVALELSGPQRLLLCGEIGPVKNKQRQTNLPNSAHRCNGLVIVTIFAPITIDSPPLLGVSRTVGPWQVSQFCISCTVSSTRSKLITNKYQKSEPSKHHRTSRILCVGLNSRALLNST